MPKSNKRPNKKLKNKSKVNGKLNKQRWTVYIIILLLIFVLWLVLISYKNPSEIVKIIGAKNSYAITFVLALLGGISTITMTSFYLFFITFVAGGVNPYLTAFFGALGLTVGELIVFYLVGLSRKNAERKFGRFKERISSVSKWLEKRPGWLIPLFTVVYIGLTPFPNELLVITLAIIKHPLKKIVIPLSVGNILFTLLISVITMHVV